MTSIKIRNSKKVGHLNKLIQCCWSVHTWSVWLIVVPPADFWVPLYIVSCENRGPPTPTCWFTAKFMRCVPLSLLSLCMPLFTFFSLKTFLSYSHYRSMDRWVFDYAILQSPYPWPNFYSRLSIVCRSPSPGGTINLLFLPLLLFYFLMGITGEVLESPVWWMSLWHKYFMPSTQPRILPEIFYQILKRP